MAQNLNYGTVLPPYYNEVWIIGGGRSALSFDLSKLKNSIVIGINEAAVRLSEGPPIGTLVVFSLDSIWVAKRRKFLADFKSEKYVALPLETFPECSGIPGVIYLKWCHVEGLSDDPKYICTGCNSGYGALNLGYLKQAKTIHLVGFDMNPRENDAYWYWARLFRDAVPQLQRNDVTVWNHNPASHIDAFPKVAL